MIKASIDIGSNSIFLLIADVIGTNIKIIHDSFFITYLGKNIDKTFQFSENSMKLTKSALIEFSKIISHHNITPQDVLVTATEASRVATNASSFYQTIEKELGLKVNIISKESEAYYSALGVSANISFHSSLTILDMGGASTEITKINTKPFKLIDTISLPIGASRIASWKKEDRIEKIHTILNKNPIYKNFAIEEAIYTGGTITSFASINLKQSNYSPTEINLSTMELKNISNFLEENKNASPEALQKKYPIIGARSETILAGLEFLYIISESLGIKKLHVSTFGLRHGVILEGKILY